MAAILKGNTATMSISNTGVLKIQIINEDQLFYQFLDIADQKAYEIVEAEIEYAVDSDRLEDDAEVFPCFYLDGDTDKETPYFLSEFMRDGYPAL